MQDFVFISGNQHKVDLLEKWLGRPVKHHKIDLDEIQSLDLRVVAEHKVRQAYGILREPVLIDDVSLAFEAMGHLPGTLIKWFLEDLGTEGLARLAARLEHQKAHASITYALYDGAEIKYFENTVYGQISPEPRGTQGFGWNAIFIPEGTDKTYAEMNDDELRYFSHRAPATAKLKAYVESRGDNA